MLGLVGFCVYLCWWDNWGSCTDWIYFANMELKVKRRYKAETYTIGTMYVDGVRLCDTLEDKDRGLRQDMSLSQIKKQKVYGQTAIPTGRYRVRSYYWPKYRQKYPLLEDVPGYTGILIHGGKNATATLGCILLGENRIKGGLVNSAKYVRDLTARIEIAERRKEEIYITIE